MGLHLSAKLASIQYYLADYHKEKFRNFMQMDLETFKELFELVNVNGLMLLVTDCCIVSFHVVSFVKLH